MQMRDNIKVGVKVGVRAMDYKIEEGPEETVFRFAGRMTFADHEKYCDVLDAVERRSGRRMVFDLAGLDFVDSSGLGLFVIAGDAARRRHRTLQLRGARADVRRLIVIAKFHNMLDLSLLD